MKKEIYDICLKYDLDFSEIGLIGLAYYLAVNNYDEFSFVQYEIHEMIQSCFIMTKNDINTATFIGKTNGE